MQQRVGLARAFATDANILLMDEPFSALDPLIRGRLQDELLSLQAKVKKTILFVRHLNPLTVLRAETVMRPSHALHRDGGGVWLDPDRRYRLTLDGRGRPDQAFLRGESLAVTPLGGYDAEQRVPPGLLVVPHNFPLRLMVHLRQASGHPVLLASGERFEGVCDDADILQALCGLRRTPQLVQRPAAQPIA